MKILMQAELDMDNKQEKYLPSYPKSWDYV